MKELKQDRGSKTKGRACAMQAMKGSFIGKERGETVWEVSEAGQGFSSSHTVLGATEK